MRFKLAVFAILLTLLSLSARAQVGIPAETGGLKSLMMQLRRASENRNAALYAEGFADDASWEGASGESALGRSNIENAMRLVFQSLGPPQFAECQIRILSPTLALLDMHQIAPGLPSRATTATAPGTIQVRGNLRTTFLVRRNGENWQIVLARLAYLSRKVQPTAKPER